MRSLLLLFMALLSLAIVERASSQILMTEDFNYTAGDSLGAHGWVSFSGGNTNVLNVATPGLIFSGYPQSNIGNSALVQRTGQDAYKQFAGVGDSTGNVYVSFMLRVDSTAAAGDYFFALLPDNSTSNYTGRFYAKDTTGGFRLGIAKATSPLVYANPIYTYGTTYVVIIKYTFVDGTNNDEVSLFVYSGAIPGSEPAPLVGPVTQAIGDASNIRRVALRQGSAANAPVVLIDGIRVFKTWGNLVGITPITQVAENFSLSQNYPNPFNPSTKINFSVPERSFVTLKVYDMLGKEVMELVNSDYSTGTYSVDMNAKGLSSGMYVYSIEARTESGNIFKDTKKLTLVK